MADERSLKFEDEVNATLAELRAPLRIAPVAGRGFGLVATIPLPAGSVVVCERPFSLTVSHRHRHQVCAVCLADSRTSEDGELRGWRLCCANCKIVHFCSEQCALSSAAVGAEPAHGQQECTALAACRFSSSDGEAADLTAQAVRILCHRLSGQRFAPFESAKLQTSYSSYFERLHGFPRDKRSSERLMQSATAALKAMPDGDCVPAKELFELLNRHQANVYGILAHGAEELALASFVGLLHLFNHSCAPNLVFDCRNRASLGEAPKFAVVTLRAVQAGEELTHCYAGSADPRNVRQAWLRTHHGFECDCPRCSTDTDMADEMDMTERLESMRCRRPECGTGLSYRIGSSAGLLRCIQCGGEWEQEDFSSSDSGEV